MTIKHLTDGEKKWFTDIWDGVKWGDLPLTTADQTACALLLRLFCGYEFYRFADDQPIDSLVSPDFDRSQYPAYPRSMFQYIPKLIPARILTNAVKAMDAEQQATFYKWQAKQGLNFGDKPLQEALEILHIAGYDFI